MSNSELSDAEAVRRTLVGDREAFGCLYDRHARAVRATVLAVAGDFGAVDDLTQETFLRGYRRLYTLQDTASFGSWIRGIARLVAREWLREIACDRHRPAADEDDLSSKSDVQEMVERVEQLGRVMAAVGILPERERLAIHAFYFHEQNATQAAAAVGVSRSGFYATLQRGIERLRKLLDESSLSVSRTRSKK